MHFTYTADVIDPTQDGANSSYAFIYLPLLTPFAHDKVFEDSAEDAAEEPEVEAEDTQGAADNDLPNYTDFTDARNG